MIDLIWVVVLSMIYIFIYMYIHICIYGVIIKSSSFSFLLFVCMDMEQTEGINDKCLLPRGACLIYML